jgi:hypothetical protein
MVVTEIEASNLVTSLQAKGENSRELRKVGVWFNLVLGALFLGEGRLLERIHDQAGLEEDAKELVHRAVEVYLRGPIELTKEVGAGGSSCCITSRSSTKSNATGTHLSRWHPVERHAPVRGDVEILADHLSPRDLWLARGFFIVVKNLDQTRGTGREEDRVEDRRNEPRPVFN